MLFQSTLWRLAFFFAIATTALTGCGRRGDLEPPSANAVQKPANNHSIDLHRANQKITPPNKDFVLDPLLK